MDKLLLKLLVIGIVVSLAWSAALSWAMFRNPEQPNIQPLSSSGTLSGFDREATRRAGERNAQLDNLVADATKEAREADRFDRFSR